MIRIFVLFLIGNVFSQPSPKTLPFTPSPEALELVGVKFIDALIKKGQMEMAKGAFKTQLEVLEKVHPEQFEKYKQLKIDDLAADAVLQQAEMAKLQPKTGNAFIDMLNGNGIPIGSSIRGLEDAIRTQRDMENNDPSEQIAKAVLEKFQTQILPGLVANMIAGRNPFKMPKHAGVGGEREQLTMVQQRRMAPLVRNGVEMEEESEMDVFSRRDLARRLRSSPRLRALLQNAEVQSVIGDRRMRDSPLGRPLAMSDADENTFRAMKARAELDQKSQIVLGIHGFESSEEEGLDTIRRAPLQLSSEFVARLQSNSAIRDALHRIRYRIDDVDKYLEPKRIASSPKPQPGFFAPRKIPTRPRKMLPLVIGMDPDEVELRRSPAVELEPNHVSRVLSNMKNNPSLAALFIDSRLEKVLTGRAMLTDEQKGKRRVKTIKALPRLFASKTESLSAIDAKVTQMIEERPVPPMFWQPKGRHTRVRWTGANEKEIPGLGTRFVLPSLDPTMPAVNSGFSTQGRARDEWDTMFKVPNNWNAGDEIGFKVNSKSKRFIGGNGAFDMPALHI